MYRFETRRVNARKKKSSSGGRRDQEQACAQTCPRQGPTLRAGPIPRAAGLGAGSPRSHGQNPRGTEGEAPEGRVEVLTASPKAWSISRWSLSRGPMCLSAKSSCLGRRRSRTREAPVVPLSPPPLLLSRTRGAKRGPEPPARRRPPPTPGLRRSPHALAHDCIDAATVPCHCFEEGQPHSQPGFWSRSPQLAAASGLEALSVGPRRMDRRGQ